MIAGILHAGSGLGNQLHRYVATRVLALEKGYDFGMLGVGNFKGASFMKLDMGKDIPSMETHWNEKKVVENGVDIRSYDPEINFVEDNTIIDGEFQDPRYFEHRLDEVREWLTVEPLEMPDDLCVINFRGGEYVGVPDLFLTRDYWNEAQMQMELKYPGIRFEVHTDDVETARKFFPWHCVHDVGMNWRSIRYAKYLILSNSSFAILPALLNQNVKRIYAPRYWARRNTGVWAMQGNYYKRFTYL
jgi:hypothetical protein